MRARRRVDKDPLEAAVFFIDRCVGKNSVATPLREAGLTVELHDDHFPQDALDENWLIEVGRRRWYVITRDDRIRYRPLEAAAARNARVGMFVLVSKNLTGPQTAEVILKALGRIRRFLAARLRSNPASHHPSDPPTPLSDTTYPDHQPQKPQQPRPGLGLPRISAAATPIEAVHSTAVDNTTSPHIKTKLSRSKLALTASTMTWSSPASTSAL